MQVTELKKTGVPAGYTADTQVSVMVITTQANMCQEVHHITGSLLEVLTSAADWLPAKEDWEIEEDGDYDMSSPESIMKELDNRQEQAFEDDPVVVVIDLATNQVIYI